MSFLDRFRWHRQPMWFATLTGPLVRRCACCHDEKNAAEAFTPPPQRQCVKCRRALAPCAFVVAASHQTEDDDKADRVARGEKDYNQRRFVRDELPKRRGARHYEQCNDCLAVADYPSSSVVYISRSSSQGFRSHRVSGSADKPAPDLTNVCDQCRLTCDAEETDPPELAGRRGCGRVLPRTAFDSPDHALCSDCSASTHAAHDARLFSTPQRQTEEGRRAAAKWAAAEAKRAAAKAAAEAADALDREQRVAAFVRQGQEATQRRDPISPRPDGVSLGLTAPSGQPVLMPTATRARHLYLIGATGTGKTTLLKNLCIQDMRAGRGLALLDPHGDAAHDLLGYVPADRLDDVRYFDPTDPQAPAFNLLALPFEPAKLTADIVSAFKMFFGESSFGPRMEHLMRHALLTLLLDQEPHSVADLRALLVDEDYRDTLARRATDDDLRSFWRAEFPSMSKDAAGPILNKIATVLVPGSALKRVFSSRANALDIPALMDSGKILLVNLSKGQLGEEPARLLGGFLTTAIAQSALARARIPEPERRPFHFYCDEFQNFAAIPSTESILSEARKYRLNLTLANQTLSQIPTNLLGAIKGNVQTFVAFNVSPDDAATMSKLMARPRYWRKLTHEHERPAAPLLVPARWAGDERTGYHLDHGDIYGEQPDKPPTTYSAEYLNEGDRQHALNQGVPPSEIHEIAWPAPSDFTNLDRCHAFVRIEKAANTSTLFVPFPPAGDPAARAAVLARARARHDEQQRQARRTQSPQTPRSPHQTADPTHDNATTFDDDPANAVHSPHDEPTTHHPPPRRLPRPRRDT